MTVHTKVFQSATSTWEGLCEEAAAFATTVGRTD